MLSLTGGFIIFFHMARIRKSNNTIELDNLRLRIRETLNNTIGESFNNESLIFINLEGKANASVRLYQFRGYDSSGTLIITPMKEGGIGPLQFSLTKNIRDTEDQVLDKKRYTSYQDFVRESCGLEPDEANVYIQKRSNALRDARRTYSKENSNQEFFMIADKYLRLSDKENFDFPFSDIAARIELYHDLMIYDPRFAGVNFEEAFLIHREDHNRIVESKNTYDMVKFLMESLILALYNAADCKSIYDTVSSQAANYLKTRMERGKKYTENELADLFGMETDTFLNLILIPAMSSDELLVETAREENGSSLYSLIAD